MTQEKRFYYSINNSPIICIKIDLNTCETTSDLKKKIATQNNIPNLELLYKNPPKEHVLIYIREYYQFNLKHYKYISYFKQKGQYFSDYCIGHNLSIISYQDSKKEIRYKPELNGSYVILEYARKQFTLCVNEPIKNAIILIKEAFPHSEKIFIYNHSSELLNANQLLKKEEKYTIFVFYQITFKLNESDISIKLSMDYLSTVTDAKEQLVTVFEEPPRINPDDIILYDKKNEVVQNSYTLIKAIRNLDEFFYFDIKNRPKIKLKKSLIMYSEEKVPDLSDHFEPPLNIHDYKYDIISKSPKKKLNTDFWNDKFDSDSTETKCKKKSKIDFNSDSNLDLKEQKRTKANKIKVNKFVPTVDYFGDDENKKAVIQLKGRKFESDSSPKPRDRRDFNSEPMKEDINFESEPSRSPHLNRPKKKIAPKLTEIKNDDEDDQKRIEKKSDIKPISPLHGERSFHSDVPKEDHNFDSDSDLKSKKTEDNFNSDSNQKKNLMKAKLRKKFKPTTTPDKTDEKPSEPIIAIELIFEKNEKEAFRMKVPFHMNMKEIEREIRFRRKIKEHLNIKYREKNGTKKIGPDVSVGEIKEKITHPETKKNILYIEVIHEGNEKGNKIKSRNEQQQITLIRPKRAKDKSKDEEEEPKEKETDWRTKSGKNLTTKSKQTKGKDEDEELKEKEADWKSKSRKNIITEMTRTKDKDGESDWRTKSGRNLTTKSKQTKGKDDEDELKEKEADWKSKSRKNIITEMTRTKDKDGESDWRTKSGRNLTTKLKRTKGKDEEPKEKETDWKSKTGKNFTTEKKRTKETENDEADTKSKSNKKIFDTSKKSINDDDSKPNAKRKRRKSVNAMKPKTTPVEEESPERPIKKRRPNSVTRSITYNYQTNKSEKLQKISLLPNATVATFKSALAKRENVKASNVRVLFAGKELLDNILLEALDVGTSTIFVYIRSDEDILLLTAKALQTGDDYYEYEYEYED